MGAFLPCFSAGSKSEIYVVTTPGMKSQPSSVGSSGLASEKMPAEPAKYRTLAGYDEFEQFSKQIKKEDTVFFYFTGSKNEQGFSWCSDCIEAEPSIMTAVRKHVKDDSNFVIVDVGDRPFWKDLNNPFRIKAPFVSVIPTLVRSNGPQRLEGSQCNSNDLLEMLFTDEE